MNSNHAILFTKLYDIYLVQVTMAQLKVEKYYLNDDLKRYTIVFHKTLLGLCFQ